MLKVKSTRSVYKNRYVDVRVDTLKLKTHIWEYVYFVKPQKNSVGIIPLDKYGLYLVRQYRHASKLYLWQIIGGMIESGNTEKETAKKELKEEAGLVAKKMRRLGAFIAEPGMSPQKTIIYTAEHLTFEQNIPHITETGIQLKYFPFKQISNMIKKEQIICGFTLSSLLLLKNNCLR